VLTRSRGMGASAVLGLAVLASYGALAAVALSAVGGGSVLSFPGWAVDAIIQVNAAPPPPTPQYGSVTATPVSPTGGQAIVVTPSAPAAGTTVAVSTGKHGGTGGSQGGSRNAGGGGSGAGRGGSSSGIPSAQRPQPARHRLCERHARRFHHRCIASDQPGRRHQDHGGLDSDHHHHARRHPPRHEHSPPSHHPHHAWHHPPRHGRAPSHHQHHAWHHPPGHAHRRHGSSHHDGSHKHGGHRHGGDDDDNSSG
jgi:hypothetical protein